MFVVPKLDREWVAWIKDEVNHRRLPCMAGCGDRAVKIKFLGKRTGAFCASCYAEIYWGRIPKLDRPKGLRRRRRRR
jgi:hypothetical protein